MIYGKVTAVNKVANGRSKLQSMDLYSLNGEHITEPPTGKPLWLVFFNTECHYCQMEIENIRRSENFKKMNVWLVSAEPNRILLSFSSRLKLEPVSGMHILGDPHNSGYSFFGVTSLPMSFLYSSNGQLIRHYKGVIRPETVLKDLNRSDF
jgi:thioredoxin-related protein